MARSTITPATATPNLPQPVGPTATASVAELRLLAGAAMAGAKSTVEKRQWSVVVSEHLGSVFLRDRRGSSGDWPADSNNPMRLLRAMNPPNSAGWSFTSGFKMLAAMRTVVPSVQAMRRNVIPDYDEMFRAVLRDPRLDEVFRAIDASESSRRYQQVAKGSSRLP